MDGHFPHQYKAGSRRGIDSRQQVGRGPRPRRLRILSREVRSMCVDFARLSLILNEIESAGEPLG